MPSLWEAGNRLLVERSERRKRKQLEQEEYERAQVVKREIARAEAREKPVTWRHFLPPVGVLALSVFIPWVLEQDSKLAERSPIMIGLFKVGGVLVAIGSACTLAAHWRGLKRGWTAGQAEDASYKYGCWVFGAPLAIGLVMWMFGSISDCAAASHTPGWAVAIIILLVAILLK